MRADDVRRICSPSDDDPNRANQAPQGSPEQQEWPALRAWRALLGPSERQAERAPLRRAEHSAAKVEPMGKWMEAPVGLEKSGRPELQL